MVINNKLLKLLRNPFAVLSNRLNSFINNLRYTTSSGYKAEKYWRERHSKYQFDLRGVGDYTMSEEENLKILQKGGQIFLELYKREKIDLPAISMLDVGCGTGFYADVFLKAGGLRYNGIDIVDTLFEGLRKKFPAFTFQQLDVSTGQITGSYDLIIMMDVAQHITDEDKFRFAMENIKAHLNKIGVIIISTNIGNYMRHNFYYVTRPMKTFEDIFKDYRISEPIQFFENKMFSIRKVG